MLLLTQCRKELNYVKSEHQIHSKLNTHLIIYLLQFDITCKTSFFNLILLKLCKSANQNIKSKLNQTHA
ncbi:hypothetical protein Hanom_Chr03g00255341 [Helianthus anomalus]